jgi:hypothetical protein
LTVNLLVDIFVVRNNSGSAGGIEMVYGTLIAATAHRSAAAI